MLTGTELEVTIPNPTNRNVVSVERSGSAITVNGAPCAGNPTVSNTGKITVTGSPATDFLNLFPGLAPGAEPPDETGGQPEIEIEANLGGGSDSVSLRGTDADDRITIGANGANVNGDNDVDVTVTDVEGWSAMTKSGDDQVTGQGDVVTGGRTGLKVTVYGGAGNDTLTGGDNASDRLRGDIGDDALDGAEGANDVAIYARAPEGGVTVTLAPVPATGSATGADGNDTLVNIESIIGSNDADRLLGNDVHNAILGFDGEDTIEARGGDDDVNGGAGCDTMDGGEGIDRVSYSTETADVEVDLRKRQTGRSASCEDVEYFSGFEGALGGSGNDTLIGNDQPNDLYGLAGIDALLGLCGDDTLNGNLGNDALSGGPGNDDLLPGDGDDVAHGGSGTDALSYFGLTGPVTVDLAKHTTGDAAGADSIAGFENAQGGHGSDRLTGDNQSNRLIGGNGDDQLWGLGGDDSLAGGNGNDALDGGPGTDSCSQDSGSGSTTDCES